MPAPVQASSPTPETGLELPLISKLYTAVVPPSESLKTQLIGYDVVVFDDFLAHSPLSCNGAAERLPVNAHCLFDTFEAASATT